MSQYKAPIRDLKFVCDELLDAPSHYQVIDSEEQLTDDVRHAIWEEAAKFSEQELAPLNQVGDQQGCELVDGQVRTPEGFKSAYLQFVENGWPSMCRDKKFGGQGLPHSLAFQINEFIGQANHAWTMTTALATGAVATIKTHGTEQLQQTYLPKLVSGEWTGTMCLTEAHCGSDLGQLRTKAEDNGDGSFKISGSKIFISGGEHDYTDNIVHIVLARLPDAPKGTKGISLFLVPKLAPDESGEHILANGVSCGSIEHKMGIHGSPTCVMNFDGSTGYLIGKLNYGLACMFTFMNSARVDASSQGLTHAELAMQGALNYALERRAGRSLKGPKDPQEAADLLVVHPDIRRMLLTIRSFAEGNRAFVHYLAQWVDKEELFDGEAQKQATQLLSFITPIAKGFCTEAGLEAASLGVQVFGGHGYIQEWGMEQNLRDARISTLYEGTTGIQALDLIGRKLMADKGDAFKLLQMQIGQDMQSMDAEFAAKLQPQMLAWQKLTQEIGGLVQQDMDELGATSVDYLMYSGYSMLAWLWAKMGSIAKQKLAQGDDDAAFYRMKLTTAEFYFAKILPRCLVHEAVIKAGCASVMKATDDDFFAVSGI